MRIGVLLFAAAVLWNCARPPQPVTVVSVKAKTAPSSLMENLWELPSLGRPVEQMGVADDLANREWMALFQSERDALKAYEKLKEVLHSDKKGDTGLLFKSFSRAPAFQRPLRKGRKYIDFVKQWVLDAIASQDDQLRSHYSENYHKIKPLGMQWNRFQSGANRLRPGEVLEVKSFQFRNTRKRPDLFFIRIERLSTDQKRPQLVSQDTLVYTQKGYEYRHPLDKPGLHRISVYNSLFFQQLYVQVTRLEVAVKSDSSHLVLWGYSEDPLLVPPYEVTVFFNRDKKVSVTTDTEGLVGIKKDPGDTLGYHRYQIVMKKGDDMAYASGRWDVRTPGEWPEYLHLYTDKQSYFPGETLRFQGIVRASSVDAARGNLKVDSLWVELVHPDGRSSYSSMLPVDGEGWFGDSISLKEEVATGQHNLRVYWKGPPTPSQQPAGVLPLWVLNAHGQGGLTINLVDSVVPPGEQVSVLVQDHGEYSGVPILVRLLVFPWDSDRNAGVEIGRDTLVLPPSGKLELEFVPQPLFEPAQIVKVNVEPLDGSRQPFESGPIRITGNKRVCSVHFENKEYPRGGVVSGEVLCRGLSSPDSTPGPVAVFFAQPDGTLEKLSVTVGKSGKIEWKYSPQTPGTYKVSVDPGPGGLVIEGVESFYVYEVEGEHWPDDSLKLTWDKPEYQPGDTAFLTVHCNRKRARLMATLEAGGLRRVWTAPISEGTGVVSVAVEENQGLHLGLPGAVGIIQRMLKVPLRSNRGAPRVRFSGKTELGPGERLEGGLQITDEQGRPVPMRYSLNVVAEELCRKIQGEDVTPRNLVSNTAAIRPYVPSSFDNAAVPVLSTGMPYFSLALADEYEPSRSMTFGAIFHGLEGGAFLESPVLAINPGEVEPRSLWRPDLRTDDSGRSHWDFSLPGSHNRWVLELTGETERGVFKMRRTIEVHHSFVSNLRGPSKVLAGEKPAFEIKIRNTTAGASFPLEIFLSIGGTGDSTGVLWDSSLVLEAPEASTELSFRPLVPREGALRFRARIKGRGQEQLLVHSFLAKGKYPVRTISHSAIIWGKEPGKQNYYRLDFNFGAEDRLSPAHIDLDYFSSVVFLGQKVFESMPGPEAVGSMNPSIAMAARFRVRNAVHRGLIKIGLNADSLSPPLMAEARELLGELKDGRNADGGWGWLQDSPSELEWTCFAALSFYFAMGQAGSADSARYAPHLKRAMSWIQSRMEAGLDENALAYAASTLCRMKRCGSVSKAAAMLEQRKARLSSYGLLLYLDVTAGLKLEEQKKGVLALLERQAINMPSEASFSGDVRSVWYSQSVEATAQALRVFSSRGLEEKYLHKLVAYLCRLRRERGWGHPKTTALTVEALIQWALQYENPKDYIGKVFFNGTKYHQFSTASDSVFAGMGHLRIPLDVSQRQNRVVLGFEGEGQLIYSGEARYYADSAGQAKKGRELGIIQTVRKLRYAESEKGIWTAEFLSIDSTQIAAGDELEITLDVKAYKSYAFLKLRAPIPTGFTALAKDDKWEKRWRPGRVRPTLPWQHHGDGVVLALEKLERGDHQFRYWIKARSSGAVFLPAAVIESELDPKLTAAGGGTEITVW